MGLLAGYLLRDKTSFLVILENRIHTQQVHSWLGAKAPAGWRCATNFLPIRVITEGVDKRENEIVGGEPDEGEEPPEKKPRDLER